jgi:hypothetical protein
LNPRSLPEIREASALFEAWERNVRDPGAAQRFGEAVQLLDDYLEGEPDSPHRAFIKNLKLANARRLIRLLGEVDKSDLSAWVQYADVLVRLLDREAQAAIAADASLKQALDGFLKPLGLNPWVSNP